MENLKDALGKFRELTGKIISSLENDDYDVLDELLDSRGEIIEYIDTLEYNKEEFREISKEIGLAELEEKLNKSFSTKRIEIKDNLDKLNKGSNVNRMYNKKLNVESIFLNKKL